MALADVFSSERLGAEEQWRQGRAGLFRFVGAYSRNAGVGGGCRELRQHLTFT